MHDHKYKAICNEDEKISKLKNKIDTKITVLERKKQIKLQQQNEQRLIQAREVEAEAAQSAANISNLNSTSTT